MQYPVKISKAEVNELPLWHFEGEIITVETEAQLEEALLALNQCKVLGFDTESKPSFRKGVYHPVSLIQLAMPDKVFLIRNLKSGFSDGLKALFENPKIVKAGPALRDDIRDLQRLRPFTAKGFKDIADIAKANGIQQMGARNLTAIFLGKRISKSQQTSNWERETLSQAQNFYAATDAYLGLKIYTLFHELGWT
ncbi:3'-5' exonuclease domain-containing protein 2 [Saprospira sp. CCB-QB6]|uniref:3'-5' exonuclease n=1 Tax=Saprospira sp. CCB-QB6 TaxID=3023936 RepID=UPI00234ABFF2|nr:3'-5' exonuclease [Saprospira sp. CCB-QB6]WCL80689.1 3'-5' exonuclease domain-containing protein 2 [Saprospira sp. CCB-QB6]